MPSPIAHVALGYAVYQIFRPEPLGGKERSCAKDGRLLALAAGLSLLPDLDFLPGLVAGNVGEFHNGATHSPFMAVLIAITVAAIAGRRGHDWRRYFLFALAAYGFHVLADFVTVGRGTMLLWPISTERISPPVHLFYGLRRSQGVFSSEHFITLANELLFVAALSGALGVVRRARRAGLPAADRRPPELPANPG